MSVRRLPEKPNLDQLKHQAMELLAAWRSGASADARSPVPSASLLLSCATGTAPSAASSGMAERSREVRTSLPLSLGSLGPRLSTSVPFGSAGG